jgi:hypothetical protein
MYSNFLLWHLKVFGRLFLLCIQIALCGEGEGEAGRVRNLVRLHLCVRGKEGRKEGGRKEEREEGIGMKK